MNSLRKAELKGLASTIAVASFGISLVHRNPSLFILTLVVVILQGVRGFDRPFLGRRPFVPLALLTAVIAGIQIQLQGVDVALALSSFLLVVQWLMVLCERSPQEENHILWIGLVHMGVIAVAAYDGMFAIYFVGYVLSMVYTLSVRRMVRRQELYPKARHFDEFETLAWGRVVRRSSLAILTLTALAFFFLPRNQGPNFAMLGSRAGRRTGFSSRVNLGQSGRIYKDHRVVMRVKVTRGELPAVPYFRGCVFDIYWSQKWHRAVPEWQGTINAEDGLFNFGRTGWRGNPNTELVFQLEPIKHTTIFTAGPTERIQFADNKFRLLFFGLHASFLTSRQHVEGVAYRTECWTDRPFLSLTGAADGIAQKRARVIPGTLKKEELRAFTQSVYQQYGGAPPTVLEKVVMLEAHLQTKFQYSLDIEDSGQTEPIMNFLLKSRRGHCEFFASSLALLLRAEGIPSRLVNGYVGREYDPFSKTYIVRDSHAHAWIEALIPEQGWVRFDPTPASELVIQKMSGMGKIASWLDELWSRHVLGFSSFDQKSYLSRLGRLIKSIVDGEGSGGSKGSPLRAIVFVVSGLLLIGGVFLVHRALRRRKVRTMVSWGLAPELQSAAALADVLQFFSKKGFAKDGHETLIEYADRLIAEQCCGQDFRELALRYSNLRFGRAIRRDQTEDRSLVRHLGRFLIREKR
jgi:hypothetical protein